MPFPSPLAVAEVTAPAGTPPSVVLKLTYDEYAQRINEIGAGVSALMRNQGVTLGDPLQPEIPVTPLFVGAFLRIRFAPVTSNVTAEGLAEPSDADVFIIDRALLAGPITFTLGTTGYPFPGDCTVYVSITGGGPDVTVNVPGFGGTRPTTWPSIANHGGTAQVLRVFQRSAGGWLDPEDEYGP